MRCRRKLFFFTEYLFPEENSTGYYLSKIVEIAGRAWGRLQVKVYFANNLFLDSLPDWCSTVDAHPIRVGKFDKNQLFQRIFRQIIISLRFAWCALVAVKTDDVVFVGTNPAFMVGFWAVLRKVRRFRYTLLVYDVFPENLVAAELMKKGSVIFRILQWIFDWAYSMADTIVVIGRDMEEVVRQKTKERGNIYLIPNWADDSAIIPTEKVKNEIILQYGLQDKIVFLFCGNLGRVQGLENLLKAIELSSGTDLAFVFIGDGCMKGEIDAFSALHQEKTVLSLGQIPTTKQQVFLNACDVALVTLGKNMYGLGVPSKSYYNMAADKPLMIVAEDRSEIVRVVQEENIGWWVPPDRPDLLANAMSQICQDDLIKMRGRPRGVLCNRFSGRVALRKYLDLLESLMK